MVALAVPVDTTVKVPEVDSDVGSDCVDNDPDPVTDLKLAKDVFDPLAHETEPVFEGAELDTDTLVADPGNGVVFETDIPLIVG